MHIFPLTRRMNHLLLIIRSYSTLLEKFNFLKKKTKLSTKLFYSISFFFGNFFSKKKKKRSHYIIISATYIDLYLTNFQILFSRKKEKKNTKPWTKKIPLFFFFTKNHTLRYSTQYSNIEIQIYQICKIKEYSSSSTRNNN